MMADAEVRQEATVSVKLQIVTKSGTGYLLDGIGYQDESGIFVLNGLEAVNDIPAGEMIYNDVADKGILHMPISDIIYDLLDGFYDERDME